MAKTKRHGQCWWCSQRGEDTWCPLRSVIFAVSKKSGNRNNTLERAAVFPQCQEPSQINRSGLGPSGYTLRALPLCASSHYSHGPHGIHFAKSKKSSFLYSLYDAPSGSDCVDRCVFMCFTCLVSTGRILSLWAIVTKGNPGLPCLKQISSYPSGLGCQIQEEFPKCHISFDLRFEVRFKDPWSRINTMTSVQRQALDKMVQ